MKKVHYAILDDMKKYLKDFNPEEYERTWNTTDQSVLEYLRDYYAKHLPVDVTAWIRANTPDEKFLYAQQVGKQVSFVRDIICPLFYGSYQECEKYPPMVISTHKSKSVLLPVYQISVPKYGLEIILRNNFYDWKVSIKCNTELNFDTMGLFDMTNQIHPVFCEGFPEDKVYDWYLADHKQFTVEIRDDYKLYTFMYLIKNYLNIKNSN